LFVIRRDPRRNFSFAASQSPAGEKLVREHAIGGVAEHSLILITRDGIYRKSGAALRIARRLSGWWPVFYGFIILPGGIRDFLYDLVARSRYRLYGKRNECFLPDPGISERFIPDPDIGE
jgi:predicted DCC family thiol-disulfide oxidoreductase YuxK